jgi:hypothetical protein
MAMWSQPLESVYSQPHGQCHILSLNHLDLVEARQRPQAQRHLLFSHTMPLVRLRPRAPEDQKYTFRQLALIVRRSIFDVTTLDHVIDVSRLARR